MDFQRPTTVYHDPRLFYQRYNGWRQRHSFRSDYAWPQREWRHQHRDHQGPQFFRVALSLFLFYLPPFPCQRTEENLYHATSARARQHCPPLLHIGQRTTPRANRTRDSQLVPPPCPCRVIVPSAFCSSGRVAPGVGATWQFCTTRTRKRLDYLCPDGLSGQYNAVVGLVVLSLLFVYFGAVLAISFFRQ